MIYLGYRKKVKKPKLTSSHIKARLKFSKYWIEHKTDANLHVYVDEKLFYGKRQTTGYCLRRIGEAYDEKNIDHIENCSYTVNCFAHLGNKFLILNYNNCYNEFSSLNNTRSIW